jgi:2-polyprenyl-3-methyl-5-hydroxy-6-metoxy-1,4-benzoquinol methylase
VLEHLANPEQLLARIHHWLHPEGILLASIPNIANVSIRAALLFGHFRYTERGILDRTHLSFYTRSSAERLITDSGFRVTSVRPTAMPYELALPFLSHAALAAPTRAFAQSTARLFPTLFGYQFVFEAVRK